MAVRVKKRPENPAYVLQADRDSEIKTKFHLRALNWEEMDRVNDISLYTPEQAAQIAEIGQRALADGRSPEQLTEEESRRINAIAPPNRDYVRRLTAYFRAAAIAGLVAIRDAIDEDGKVVEMSPAEFLRDVDDATVRELGAEIVNMTRHSGVEIKK